MNMKKLNKAVEILKGDLGEGLTSCDIFTVKEGLNIVGHNSQAKASLPSLGQYYIIDLEGNHMVIVLP